MNKTDKVESYEEVDPIILSYGFSEEEAKYRFHEIGIWLLLQKNHMKE